MAAQLMATNSPLARGDLLMDRPGKQLLAGAAGAEQHDRDVGAGDPLDGADHLDHFRAAGEQGAHRSRIAAGRLQPAVFRLDLMRDGRRG